MITKIAKSIFTALHPLHTLLEFAIDIWYSGMT